MASGADVVACARGWLRTPYHHQARARGLGCDCGGLIGGVAVELGIVPADWWAREFDPRFGGYARVPRDDSLARVLAAYLEPIEPPAALLGDVLSMHFEPDRQEHHVGILADYAHGGGSIIHAMSRHPAMVVEHRLAPEWRRRIVAAYRYPGLIS